ncbi:thioredoxin domain-containing protein 15-like [Liolophura sinensis]|uniref:thioredoxin domain-containing protein 15-like n=1 Tax=Liolophura sinensis TaxID=3198878 RepID=UPI0031593FCE
MASNELSVGPLSKYFILLCFAVLVTCASSEEDEQTDAVNRVLTVAASDLSSQRDTLDDGEDVSVDAGDEANDQNAGDELKRDTTERTDVDEAQNEINKVEALGSDESILEDSKNDSASGFFSLENILRTVIQPVLEEFNNGKSSEVKPADEEVTEEATPMAMLEIETPVVLENLTDPMLEVQTSENGSLNAEVEKTAKKLKFQCHGKNVTENDTAIVKIVNGTELLNRISFKTNESRSDCVLVMFFAPWCHFSAQTAPHYNALGRAYPNLDVLAVDAIHFSNLNARFGTVSVPNVLLFHQSRAVVKFNQSTRSFDNFVQFVKNLTGLDPNVSVVLEDQDYEGPLPSVPIPETDYLLWLAWVFVCACSTYMFTVSSTGQHIINRVMVLWQEHQHIE